MSADMIDWQAICARLADMAARADGFTLPSPEQVEAVLTRRAAALARPLDAAPALTLETGSVTFACGELHFAIETEPLREVVTLGEIVPLPGAPPFVAGVTALRGEILPLIDLPEVLAMAAGKRAPRLAVVLGEGPLAFGIPVDSASFVTGLTAEHAGAMAGIDTEFVRGVAPDGRLFLNGRALRDSARLFVST